MVYLYLIWMKVDDSLKRKPPVNKPEEKPAPEKAGGVLSKLKFPELPIKQAIAIPLVVLILAIAVVGLTQLLTGAPVHLGLDFKGGISMTVLTDKSTEQLQSDFSGFPLKLVGDGTIVQNGVTKNVKVLRFSQMDDSQTRALDEKIKGYTVVSRDQVGSTFSQSSQTGALIALLIAFGGMALTIFIIFRNFVPSIAVILSAFADIMFAVAMMNVFGIELTFGTFAALLMLIGYSVDTDILLTTKILGERKYVDKKIASCRVTGLTMTFAAIAAFLVLLLVSKLAFVVGMTPIPLLENIAIVMIFGLVADVFNTWFLNAGILRWYMDTPEAKAKYG